MAEETVCGGNDIDRHFSTALCGASLTFYLLLLFLLLVLC